MPDLLSRRWSPWYSKTQTAMFVPLTRVNRPHHQAKGFDQARKLDRACHSKLMGRTRVVAELTFDCNTSVIIVSQVCGGLRARGGR